MREVPPPGAGYSINEFMLVTNCSPRFTESAIIHNHRTRIKSMSPLNISLLIPSRPMDKLLTRGSLSHVQNYSTQVLHSEPNRSIDVLRPGYTVCCTRRSTWSPLTLFGSHFPKINLHGTRRAISICSKTTAKTVVTGHKCRLQQKSVANQRPSCTINLVNTTFAIFRSEA